MKSYSILPAVALAAVLGLSSCGQKARISGVLDGAADSRIVVRQLDINVYNTLDTISTGADGAFRYSVKVKKGQPEFIYLFHGDTRIASLLLESGETATVKADTLGNYSVEGSEGSSKLAEVEKEHAAFMGRVLAAGESEDGPAMGKAYLDHYRNSVKFVLANPYSLTTVPVLFERLGEATPIFNQPTDAIFFKNALDSLKTVYPESRYVTALEKETSRRMKLLELDNRIRTATQASFPDLNLPDINGERKALSSVDSKVILVHFWDSSDAAQKMMNIDTLLPVYEDFHDRGFEIYSVCLHADKAAWGSIVSSQKLPWINVNDGLGAASPVIATYNVTSLPNSLLIVDGELSGIGIKGAEGLRKELGRILRRQ